jgi:hypothetical protein
VGGAEKTQNRQLCNLFKQTIDLRYKDTDVDFGKLTLILIGNYVKGAEVTPNGGSVVTPTNGFSGVFNPSNPTAFNGSSHNHGPYI